MMGSGDMMLNSAFVMDQDHSIYISINYRLGLLGKNCLSYIIQQVVWGLLIMHETFLKKSFYKTLSALGILCDYL